jgi:2-dehydropantoate 2-reductase
MRIAVVGAGGVGGYFAARLAGTDADVEVIARGAHLAAIREHGLRVTSPRGDLDAKLIATDNPSDVGAVDFVIFAVKSYDTDEAAAILPPLLGPETVVVSIQNGVDNEDRIARVIGADHVAGGVAFLLAEITKPGVIEHRGGPDRLVVGDLAGGPSARLRQLVDIANASGLNAELSPDIRAQLWSKFAFICAQAGTTAAARASIGAIRADPEGRRVFQAIVAEVAAVAKAEGIVLPDDLVDRHAGLADSLSPDARSSLHDDLVAGRRIELEALHGGVVRRAAATGVPAPVTATIYGLLHPFLAHT